MRKRKYLDLLFIITIFGFISFFACTDAGAVADCDGFCSSTEAAAGECATWGLGGVMEFCGASNGSCLLSEGGSAPCTAYFYRYTGDVTNQVDVAIPLKFNITIDDKYEVHCSQYITDGSGDPNTAFGKGFSSLGICRMANNLSVLPMNLDPAAPPTANFYIATDPSSYDDTARLDWEVRQIDKTKVNLYHFSLVGPSTLLPPVSESGATITTSSGNTCEYKVIGGKPYLKNCPGGKIVPQDQMKLCAPTVPGQVKSFTSPQGQDFTCETISYMTEQCDIKTSGTDPWRYIGGSLIYTPY